MTDDDTKRVVAKPDSVAHSPNAVIAGRLREAADLLSHQGANPFRVSAYRRAADTLLGLPGNVDDILRRDGVDGLIALPGALSMSHKPRMVVVTGMPNQRHAC